MNRPAYPPAPRHDVAETIHGQVVSDPYRWLEEPESDETKRWLAEQDDLFKQTADALPGRPRLTERIRQLLGAGNIGPPVWRGERRFFVRRTPEQEHAALYVVDPDGAERTLLDPMEIDPAGTTTLDSWQPDKEGRLLAYQLSKGGDEESLLYVPRSPRGRSSTTGGSTCTGSARTRRPTTS
jgi:prolyl oligopeptidase